MKTLKVSDYTHKELKKFCVNEGVNIQPIADVMITQGLINRNHKFDKTNHLSNQLKDISPSKIKFKSTNNKSK